MGLQTYTPKLGRTPNRSRITAGAGGNGTIAITLSGDLAQYLGAEVHGKLRVELGIGQDRGKMRLSVAATGVSTVPAGRRLRFNIRRDSLPDVIKPGENVTLPHELCANEIVVDLSPLAQKLS